MGSKAMAERVWRGAKVEAGDLKVFQEHPVNAASGDAPAEAVGEDGRRRAMSLADASGWCSAFHAPYFADFEPALKGFGREAADGGEAFAAAFAADADEAFGEVKIAVVHADRFADAQAG